MTKKPTSTVGTANTATAAPEATAQLQKQPQERKVTQMDQPRFKGVEFMRSEYLCTAHPNTTPEDLLAPEYWAHISAQLRPRDRIEAWANDGSWMAEYVVLEAGRNWANVKTLNCWNLSGEDIARTSAAIAAEYAGLPYEVKFRGEHCLWSVLRKSDNAVMHENEGTKGGADQWLRERMKADRT